MFTFTMQFRMKLNLPSANIRLMKQYKVIIYREGIFGSILLGASKVDPERFSEFLNYHAEDGWRVISLEREERRTMLFFKREAFLVVLEKERP